MHPLDELKKLSMKELEEEIKKSDLDLLKLKLAVSAKQSKNTSTIKYLKKYIARVKTLQRLLEMEKAPENAASPVIT